jgi:NAD(P) transhydrogenase subunit beta
MGSVFMVLALIYGFSFVAPIGGADMPVVISLLNSFTGLSAAVTGLIYGSQFMLVGGILVGASGTILTVLMCEAMNRSLMNVLIGGFGGGGASAKGADGEQVAKEVTLNDAAIQLFYSQSAIIVPGYGLAVAQAQKVCKEVDELLEKNGVEVRYAIHPVAGRMPGHMNVLLAEADVPYPKLLDLEEANDALKNTDMVVIVGANDVVNPAAEDDPGSPIYGMPVLKVWEAKNVIVLKRSMRPGYAGIENPLFFHEKTRMLFGDAKDTLSNLASEIKSL